MPRTYLDHAATSPLRPEARDALLAALVLPGNPSSVHAEGRAARACLEGARRAVAARFGVGRDGVVFTGGGTEANALALHQAGAGGGVALVAATAHPSALAAPDVEPLPVDARGQSDPAWLERRLAADPPVALVSTVAVNNETGIVDAALPDLARLARARGALVHLDRTQDLGDAAYIPAHADLATVSAHKLGGPK
ncbi:MAG: aminotransferase class V-fold PLP-dependent enzyme, partial [Geminicoccaceae bacterium]|nr:aminotransferase class V-fold PLP-dependent enzyme [Geminicoccaceae bacterium]